MRKIFTAMFFVAGFGCLFAEALAHPAKQGHVDTIFSETKTFLNKDCQSAGTCDLVRFALKTKRYEVWFSDYDPAPSYGTSAVAEYETDSVESLEKYAIVQFVRGCSFYSSKKTDGSVEKHLGIARNHFGEHKYMCFPEWVIDSVDKDPVYGSDPELGRFYYYKWNSVFGSHNRKTEILYSYKKPVIPILYITDINDRAFTMEFGAKNVSTQFKTCLYRTKDVPLLTTPENINFAEPIKCFDWESSYIYNHDLGIFESKREIDPFCKQKPPPY